MNSGLRIFRTEIGNNILTLPQRIQPDPNDPRPAMQLRRQIPPDELLQRKGKSHIQPIKDTLRFSQLIITLGMMFAHIVLGPIVLFFLFGFLVSLGYDILVFNLPTRPSYF